MHASAGIPHFCFFPKQCIKMPNTRRVRKTKGGADFNDSEVLGVGGFGIALTHAPNNAVKLLYDIEECNALRNEAKLQVVAETLLRNIVRVPKITDVFTEPVIWKGKQYLCGIAMERVPFPEGFDEPVHMLLGYHESDVNQSWGKHIGQPIGPNNPTRGFFASADCMEAIWEDENQVNMTIGNVAYTMGKALRALIDGGIVPVDLEWLYSNNEIWLIDFGLCRFGKVDPATFFFQNGKEGLYSELYTPKEGDKGYTEYFAGFFHMP